MTLNIKLVMLIVLVFINVENICLVLYIFKYIIKNNSYETLFIIYI